jgi:hypothetical protein
MAWCTVSIDGYSSGPGGPEHDNWLYEHVMRPATNEYFEGIWRGCDTAFITSGANRTPQNGHRGASGGAWHNRPR